jgi:hypothetical protein
MFGSVGEKTTNEEHVNDEVAAPVAVSQNWTWSLNLMKSYSSAFLVPAIAVPSDEKERKWWNDPMTQLAFVLTKTYLKEFVVLEEDDRGVENVVLSIRQKLRYVYCIYNERQKVDMRQ